MGEGKRWREREQGNSTQTHRYEAGFILKHLLLTRSGERGGGIEEEGEQEQGNSTQTYRYEAGFILKHLLITRSGERGEG